MIRKKLFKTTILFFLLESSFLLQAQNVKVLTNQVGYENTKPKRAMIMADRQLTISTFQLINTATGNVAYSGKPIFSGPVNKWKTGFSGPLILAHLPPKERISCSVG